MNKLYLTRDPLTAPEYIITKDPAQRLILVPTNPLDKILKGNIYSFPCEDYNDFTNRIGLIPV